LGPWAGSRIRIADGDRKLTDYEVAVLLANRTEPRQDLTPIAAASLDDLDPVLVEAFLRRIRDTKSDIFRRVDDQRALTMLNVLTTHEDRVVPTLAGLLVFGLYPQTFEPQREALVNALVHRDYSEFARGMQVQVELYPDRLLIRNPGGLYGPVDVGSLGTTTVTSSRNRALLKILEDTPFGDGNMVCENRGTGIARMLVALGEAGMEPPRFTDDISSFAVEFPNHTLLDEDALAWLTSLPLPPLSRSQMTALVMMRNGAVLTNSSYRSSTSVRDSRLATRDLKEMVDIGVVEQAGTRGSATYQLTASARSGAAVGGRPTVTDINVNERRIMDALVGAAYSRAELEQATGMTKDQVQHALQTLRQKGRITMIGKPRARNTRWTANP
jgi:ATP-dependent DNA helicase RecG